MQESHLPSGPQSLYVDEMYHRMVNVFQIMTSLGEMHLEQVSSPEGRLQLSWMLERIYALSMLQRHLDVKPSGAFGEYLEDAAAQWHKVLGEREISMRVKLGEGPVIPARSAVTLALITHELLTNCVEHAFARGKGGTIVVNLQLASDNLTELSVSDDGCGFPPGLSVDFCNTKKGLGLVGSLASQIGGRFTVKARHPTGTSAVIVFPV